jgi:nicotinate phosphoribosyltransferase
VTFIRGYEVAPLPAQRQVHRAILSGDTADVYFSRARTILRAENINPVVTMEVFPRLGGALCGMTEVSNMLHAVLRGQAASVLGLEEGSAMSANEVVLSITAPYDAFGLYETALLGTLAHCSGWATAARECVEAAEGRPVISFGARHVHPLVGPILDYAAIVGGCITGSTPAGAKMAGLSPSGTMPHAMILIFGDTVSAAQAFDRHMPKDIPLVVLVDTFKDEAEESVRVAQAMEGKLYGVRLDTPAERGRVTTEMVQEVRARLDTAGFPEVKIIASGGMDPERISGFLREGAQVDSFGVGSYISKAAPIDFTGDLKVIDGQPIAKRGRIPGVTPNPRLRPLDL